MTESKHCEVDTGAGPVQEAQQEPGGKVLNPVPIWLRKSGPVLMREALGGVGLTPLLLWMNQVGGAGGLV